MVSTLVFSITTAGLLFLVLGERLGLPAPLGILALQALLAFSCLLMILLSATNRLEPFLIERPRARSFGRIARLAVLLLAGMGASGGLALEDPARVGFLLVGFLVGTMLLLPQEAGFGGERNAALAMGGLLRRFAVALLALVLLVQWLPAVFAGFAAVLQRDPSGSSGVVMAGLALAVIAGGAAGLSRLARALLLLALVFAVLPLGFASFLERSFPWDSVRGTWVTMLRDLPTALPSSAWRSGLPDALAGFAIGALGSAQRPAGERATRSILLALAALVIALAGSMLVMSAVVQLHGVILGQIAEQPPARWPLFVFDDTIHGWLRVCGEAPRDVLDAFRACRARGLAGSFPASEIRLEPGLVGPAVAASRGLPVVLGAGWMLASPLICLVALGLLLHGAALLASEGLLYRLHGEKALRSSRLLLARFFVLVPIVLLALVPASTMPPRLAIWLMLGSVLLIVVARFADLIRASLIALRSRAPAPASFTPSEASP